MKTSIQRPPLPLKACLFISLGIFSSLLVLEKVIASDPKVSFLILFSTGWLLWTFLEYFIHRFLMHELIIPGSKDNLFHHHEHHRNPQDLKVKLPHRLVFLLIFLIALKLSIQSGGYTPIFSGLLGGFSTYNLIHYLLHQPIGRYFFPRVQRAHILHHYHRPHHGYSFSTSLWDWLFGTQPPKSDIINQSMLRKYFHKTNFPITNQNQKL